MRAFVLPFAYACGLLGLLASCALNNVAHCQAAATHSAATSGTAAAPALDVAHLTQLTRDYPKSPDAWTSYGVALYGAGNADQAVQALQSSLQLRPGDATTSLFLALSQADLGECESALPTLRGRFALGTQGQGTQDKLARLTGLSLLSCLALQQDSANAVQVAVELRQRFHNDADVLYETAELYTRMWTQAAGELMRNHPESFRVHQLAAEVYDAQNNYDQAVREYQIALTEQPRLPDAHFRIGQLLLRKGGENADALASDEFRSELAIHPRSATAALALAEIDRHDNQLDDAVSEYRLALKIRPGFEDASVGLARTLLAQKKTAEAEGEVRALLVRQPDNTQAHYTLMLIYREEGKAEAARDEMATFHKLQAQEAAAYQKNLGALLAGEALPVAHAARSTQ